LQFALKRYEEREKELMELLEEKTNQYKKNALGSELKSVENAKKLLTNFIKTFRTRQAPVSGPMEGIPSWQVLKVALLFPILGRVKGCRIE
jgi:hypothetical protein